MHLNTALVARPGLRLVFPDDLLVAIDLRDARRAQTEKKVPVGEQRQVVAIKSRRILPLNLALGVDDGYLALIVPQRAIARPVVSQGHPSREEQDENQTT